MNRTLFVVLGTVLLTLCLPASAATVISVKGKVLINRGDGFQQTTTGALAKAGDLVMASAGASAVVSYPGGCQVKVIPGRVVSVGEKPPCTAPSLIGEADDSWYRNPLVPFGVTAAVGWGIFCATVYCRDEGGGGGRRFNAGFGQPASP